MQKLPIQVLRLSLGASLSSFIFATQLSKPALADFGLCNRTGSNVLVAIAHTRTASGTISFSSTTTTVQGWYSIPPGVCSAFWRGDNRNYPRNERLFFYAQSGATTWNPRSLERTQNRAFCLHPTNRFNWVSQCPNSGVTRNFFIFPGSTLDTRIHTYTSLQEGGRMAIEP